ncbi:MAG: tRNA (cytidine(34)-2'-O)-methyltransferase [Rhodospirillaceae bacterium]|jgi:tRNA (cytidine/uridine-2'-O-)-methyltransferase|nr:tRNA (cytidine(34)-2'-O)-methyltransferase [Rhodospirillaceae bacterium]MBT5664151.1 tRNA (cytidine(34)-2'-O)-methyltransferase [Rhodospirillaceae bacterium]MBT5812140.1 tRNA (cytidine(34)-2'-O)-methyltransferase [Rhodospirillaceae bacterium]
MRVALYQPDIPQNTGAILRLAACLDVGVDIIEPCGFVWSDRRLRRAGMDYLDQASVLRHQSWSHFQNATDNRLILLTTRGDAAYTDFQFNLTDTLIVGRESAGAPAEVHAAMDATLYIPMQPQARSLNVALALAMVLGEAVRQTNGT